MYRVHKFYYYIIVSVLHVSVLFDYHHVHGLNVEEAYSINWCIQLANLRL